MIYWSNASNTEKVSQLEVEHKETNKEAAIKEKQMKRRRRS